MEKIYEMNSKRLEKKREILLEELGIKDIEKGTKVFGIIGIIAIIMSVVLGLTGDVKTYVLFSVSIMFVLVGVYLKKFNKFSEEEILRRVTKEDVRKIQKYKNLSDREIEDLIAIRKLVLKKNTVEVHSFNIITEIKKKDIKEIKVKNGFILIKMDLKNPAIDLLIPEDIFSKEERNKFLGSLKSFQELKKDKPQDVDLFGVFNITIEQKREKVFKFFMVTQVIGLLVMGIAVILQYGEINLLGGMYIISILLPTMMFIIGYINMQKERSDLKIEEDHIKILEENRVNYLRIFEGDEMSSDEEYIYFETMLGKIGTERNTFTTETKAVEVVENFNRRNQ